jgi:hypothetical protein
MSNAPYARTHETPLNDNVASLTRTFRYVPLARIPEFLALGWDWSPDEPPLHQPHGSYSVIMEFVGDGEPVEPGEGK